MGFYCKIIADSINPFNQRLTTIEICYPRFIHAEILTHRDRARNSASSRAIPWPKMMERILLDPVVPIRFGSEQKGMQTGGEIDNVEQAKDIWLDARDSAVAYANKLAELGVHKSICNRLTEPFMWITVVMTATNWQNFFRLRCHSDAEIHFQEIAKLIEQEIKDHEPSPLDIGDWHLPYLTFEEIDDLGILDNPMGACKISTARCARVSYLTQDGKRNAATDLALFERLYQGSGFGHWSPHEHVAMAFH